MPFGSFVDMETGKSSVRSPSFHLQFWWWHSHFVAYMMDWQSATPNPLLSTIHWWITISLGYHVSCGILEMPPVISYDAVLPQVFLRVEIPSGCGTRIRPTEASKWKTIRQNTEPDPKIPNIKSRRSRPSLSLSWFIATSNKIEGVQILPK